jgi:hypothetical protein
MSCRDKIASIHQTILPVKMLLLLAFCLGGLSAHFLADNFEHFLWQPVAETSSLQADHDDHLEQYTLSTKQLPADRSASVQCAHLHDGLYCLFPPLNPLLHPPKSS